jgi:tRNA(fMet)-specific endonuclease VapC
VNAPRFLLDTNICIYIARQRPPALMRRAARLAPGEAVISIITHGELHYGAARSQRRAAAEAVLDELQTLLPVQALPASAGRFYGEIRARLEAAGETIGGNDLWIAAHARAAGLTLVTNNTREFRRVPGLRLQNWAEP